MDNELMESSIEVIIPEQLPKEILRYHDKHNLTISKCTRKPVDKECSKAGEQYAVKSLGGSTFIWNLGCTGWVAS